jgi:hypothetical protein
MRIRRAKKRKKGPLLVVISAVLLVCLLEAFLGGCTAVGDTRNDTVSPLAGVYPTQDTLRNDNIAESAGIVDRFGN